MSEVRKEKEWKNAKKDIYINTALIRSPLYTESKIIRQKIK